MKKFDGRKLDHKTREQLRILAVKLVETGEGPEHVNKTLGFHRSCVYHWIAKCRKGGDDALKTRKITGRPPNNHPFIGFLERLPHKLGCPIYLTVEAHPAHKSTKVKKQLRVIRFSYYAIFL